MSDSHPIRMDTDRGSRVVRPALCSAEAANSGVITLGCTSAARVTRAKELGAASVVGDVPPYRVKHMERLGFTVVQPPKKGITLPNVEWTVVYLEF